MNATSPLRSPLIRQRCAPPLPLRRARNLARGDPDPRTHLPIGAGRLCVPGPAWYDEGRALPPRLVRGNRGALDREAAPVPGRIFGVVQGLTESLPLSSSAHLVLLALLGRRREDLLDLEVALHRVPGAIPSATTDLAPGERPLGTNPHARELVASSSACIPPSPVAGRVLSAMRAARHRACRRLRRSPR